MAILGVYAMENEKFANIVSQKSMKVKFVNPSKTVSYRNHNKLLRLYENCIGIKTGFTKAAGRCLVSCAEKNGIRLICVTLNAPSDWDDHINLYNFGFENTVLKNFDDHFKINIKAINKDEKIDLECKCENSFSCSIKKGEESNVKRKVILPETINAPIEKGQIVGNVVYYLGDTPIGKNNIISDREIKNMVEPKKNFFYSIMNFFRKCLGGK